MENNKNFSHENYDAKEANSTLSRFKAELSALALAVTLNAAPAEAKAPKSPNPSHSIEMTTNSHQAQKEGTTANFYTDSEPQGTESVEKQEVPDYIGQAPEKLKEYYPEWEKHFQKIFEVIKNNILEEDLKVFNEKLEDELYLADTEKDKRTLILMFIEMGYPETAFREATQELDEDGFDPRVDGATTAYKRVGKYMKDSEKQLEEELAKEKKRWEELKKNLEQMKKLAKATKEKREETIKWGEKVIEELDPESIKYPQIQELVEYYQTVCKENGREMTQKAKELLKRIKEIKAKKK